jgi:hypothetical protein
MPDFVYELRRGDAVIATGRVIRELPLEVGERLTIGSHNGIVRTVQPQLGERDLHLPSDPRSARRGGMRDH